jgi:hypothetical protein
MDPAALALAMLVWHGSTDVAAGRAELGPWQMNESRWDYVDDATAAIDERGGIAVAWADQGQKDVLFRKYSAQGKPLGAAVNVSRSPKIFSWLPRLALDASGRIFVLWQEIIFSGGSHGGEILFARSEDGGKTFSPPLNLSNSRAGDGKGRITAEVWHNGSLDLALGNDGTLYAAWTEYEGALWLRRSTDAGKTFSSPLRIADAKPARAPALAVSNRTVYLAWTVGDDKSADIRVARSDDGGASFAPPSIVEQSKAYSDAPRIAVDARGTLHMVYAESERGLFGGRHVRYARSMNGGAAWERARDISERDAGFPALDIDAKGNLYVLWERFADHPLRSRGLALAVSADSGRTFSAPVLVPESTDGGWNGSLQGMLMRKLAVNRSGAFAIVNSSIKEKEASRVWLMRGQLNPR